MYWLIGIAFIDLVCMLILSPWNLVTWVCVGTTLSFMLRPLGVYVKLGKILPLEFLVYFLVFNFSLVIGTFSLVKYLLMIVIRLLFYAVVYYDDTQYVRVQEEEEIEL